MQISFIRRLDELGRIVIPKEIRNKLNFNFGDLLDLNIENEALLIKKNISSFNIAYINNIIFLLEYLCDCDIIITDKEKIIAKGKNFVNINLDEPISNELTILINEHKSGVFDSINVCNNFKLNGKINIKSLIKDSNTLGVLIIKFNEDIEDVNNFLNLIEKILLK